MSARADRRRLEEAWSRPGGDWAGMRPTLDNPFTWSMPLVRVGGLTIRLHVLFIAFIVVQLIWSIVPSQLAVADVRVTAIALGALFVVVLAHECGHVIMCRLGDGMTDEILMWPLGGLAHGEPARTPRAHFWAAMGGPMANLAIITLAAPIVLLMTRDWGAVIPNPLDPLAYARDPLIGRSMPMLLLYMINALSVMLLAFNLLPMFPLDGGRLVHAILWQRRGWSASMRLTVRVGFLAGLALLLYGVVSYAWQAVAVAAFGLLTCYQTERQLAFSDSMLDFESDDYALKASRLRSDISDTWNDRDSDECHGIMDEPDDPSEQSDIDRILKKIASSGLSSLTNEEQQALQRETERKRRESR